MAQQNLKQQQQQQQNQEEIIYNYNQNSHSDTILKRENEKTTTTSPLSYPILDEELIALHYFFDDVETKSLFAFRVINRDYIKIRLNYESMTRIYSSDDSPIRQLNLSLSRMWTRARFALC